MAWPDLCLAKTALAPVYRKGGGAGAERLLQVMDDGDWVRMEAVEMERRGWL